MEPTLPDWQGEGVVLGEVDLGKARPLLGQHRCLSRERGGSMRGSRRGLGDYRKPVEGGAGSRKDIVRTYGLHLTGCDPVIK